MTEAERVEQLYSASASINSQGMLSTASNLRKQIKKAFVGDALARPEPSAGAASGAPTI